jgi:hypothetical protein
VIYAHDREWLNFNNLSETLSRITTERHDGYTEERKPERRTEGRKKDRNINREERKKTQWFLVR